LQNDILREQNKWNDLKNRYNEDMVNVLQILNDLTDEIKSELL
jgi:hypothetical protein